MTSVHQHPESGRTRSPLIFAITLTFIILVAELTGGIYSRSLALLSDAGHVFMDLLALCFALFALLLAGRPPSDRRTFGLHRIEVLAALLNGLLVVGLACWILWASVGRFNQQVIPRVVPMVVLGSVGFLANIIVAWRLHHFSKNDLNIRGAFLHVASDALASVGVVIAAFTIYSTGWTWVDPAVGIGIAAIIFVNAGRLLRESLNLLMEGVPRHLKVKEVEEAIQHVPGVLHVSDLHLWGLCSHITSLSAHLTVQADAFKDSATLIESINSVLHDKFRISHSTLQLDPDVSKK